jgi:hypothetical protein
MKGEELQEKYSPLRPMSFFFKVMGIFGGFPLSPVSNSNFYHETEMVNSYNGRRYKGSKERKSIDDHSSWDNFYAFELSNFRLAWCYISNTLFWVFILAIFFAISYGNEYSGLDYLFPLNVSSR